MFMIKDMFTEYQKILQKCHPSLKICRSLSQCLDTDFLSLINHWIIWSHLVDKGAQGTVHDSVGDRLYGSILEHSLEVLTVDQFWNSDSTLIKSKIIFLTQSLEYILFYILDRAGDLAIQRRSEIVEPCDYWKTIQTDEQLILFLDRCSSWKIWGNENES